MFKVDINSDIGESFGLYSIGMDEEIVKHITSANIACGFHAGDPCVMDRTVQIAKRYGTAVGAHPGFPDLLGFGRRMMDIDIADIRSYIIYQTGALKAFAEAHGLRLQHVKIHGALNNMAAKNYDIALAAAQAVAAIDEHIIFIAQSNTQMVQAGKRAGLRVANEVFADRTYSMDGTLVSRKFPGAVIGDTDVVCRRVVRMVKEGKVEAIDGSDLEVKADTICVHGDNPEAVLLVKKIAEALKTEGVKIVNLGDFVV